VIEVTNFMIAIITPATGIRKPDSAVSVQLPAPWSSTKSGVDSPLATLHSSLRTESA
jgi:hypothetical protein